MSIATYIKDDLAVQLLSGRELPVDLTLDSLAEHYKVSRMPVRTAVAALIDEGLLTKRPNRRLTPCPPPNRKSRAVQTRKRPERPSAPYEVIARDLVQLSFQGEPVYLREEATAEKYGISRSAIRIIFHRLAAEGMLDHIPRRGWRLRPFRQDDLQDYNDVREVLELRALKLAWRKLDANVLQRLLDANRLPESPNGPLHCDNSLHEYFIATAGNAYIREFFERHRPYHRLLFNWEGNNRAIEIESIRQHREILTAVLAKNWLAARKALSNHIRNNHPILSQAGMKENQWLSGDGEQGRRW